MGDLVSNIWRFYTSGHISGIVLAESEEAAKEKTAYYLKIQFDLGKETDAVSVWKVIYDDDFRDDFPFAVAVSY